MRICFFGDSLVNGTRDPECLGWVGRVCAAEWRAGHDLTLYNLGVRHETSSGVRARWRREAALRLLPDQDGRLVFAFGVNDCRTHANGQQREETFQSLDNLRAILDEARQWLPVLFIGLFPVADYATNLRIASLSSSYMQACRDLDVPCLEPFPILAASPAWMREVGAGDGVHPGAEGYALLASLVQAWPAWRAWF